MTETQHQASFGSHWVAAWQAAMHASSAHGGETRPLSIEAPASCDDVRLVELKIGVSIPKSFARVLTEFSSSVSVHWTLPQSTVGQPWECKEIFGGIFDWNLKSLPEMHSNCLELERIWDCDDAVSTVFHNVIPVIDVMNGDFIALDLKEGMNERVIYLSHDANPDEHGIVLANDFIDFMNRWTQLGSPGPEGWCLTPFVGFPDSGIRPEGLVGRRWSEWFFGDPQQSL